MILLLVLLSLLSSDCRVLDNNVADTADTISVVFKDKASPLDAQQTVAEILEVPLENIHITDSNQAGDGRTVSFTVDGNGAMSDIISSLSASPLITVVSKPDDLTQKSDPKKDFWQSPWFVVTAAILAGLVLFLMMVPPIYICLKRRKSSELEGLDSQAAKRYDTMGTLGRDGSIQSRRKLAPTTLTLADITQPSIESSDSDTSPPGIKEALQSRSSPLTPLQLRQRLDNPALLYAEFSSMPTNEESRAVKKSSMKNRYKGVLPNIHTRVKLKCRRSNEDYINGNYIKGYKGMPRLYIATQGPLKNTVNDFWNMVWHEKVNTIVMITKLQEKGRNKCVIYWPETVGTYDNYTVTVRDSTKYEGFTVTSMLITDGVTVHRLCHLWMWSWPDQGVPESSRSLISLLSCVHSIWQLGSSPLVVHCSAGLGRTGCFIAVDIGIQALKHDRAVDILKIVANMRLDRGGMVQTLEQYEFIHRALLRHEVALRNKLRFKGLRQASFSHEGPPEVSLRLLQNTNFSTLLRCSSSQTQSALYSQTLPRRMSFYSTSYTSHDLEIASTSLPTYISPLLSGEHPEIPSPDSPKPPSLLQLSQLMEKSSKRKLFKRTTAVDFSVDVDFTDATAASSSKHPSSSKQSPVKLLGESFPAADDSSPELLKTPALTKSSFSLDFDRLEKLSGKGAPLPRSASEDTPEHQSTGTPIEPYSCASVTVPYFTFDFEPILEPDDALAGSAAALRKQSPLDSPIVINT